MKNNRLIEVAEIIVAHLCCNNQSKLRKKWWVCLNQFIRILFYIFCFNCIIQLLEKWAHNFCLWLPKACFIDYKKRDKLKTKREAKPNKTRTQEDNVPKKLFPRSPTSTLDPSTTVMLPIPPRTRFLSVSEPVGPQLSKQIFDFSRAACPWSPHILHFQE